MPKVSVVINCHNGEKYLREAIESVYGQSYKDWEIILWDDASTDKTPEIAKAYDNRLRYFRGEKAISLGQARNWALEKVTGKYIGFLDYDDIWLPQKLEKQIPLFENDPETGIVICDVIQFNELGHTNLLYKTKKPKTGYVFEEIFANNFICYSSTMLRKADLDSLNEWHDIRFHLSSEAELFSRIAHDWRLGYVDEPLVKYRIHKKSLTYLRPELSASESEIMIRKFKEIYPNFGLVHKAAILRLQSHIQLRYASLDLEARNKKKVRERLRPFLATNPKIAILFICSFLPLKFYRKLVELYKKYIGIPLP